MYCKTVQFIGIKRLQYINAGYINTIPIFIPFQAGNLIFKSYYGSHVITTIYQTACSDLKIELHLWPCNPK